MQKRLLYVPGQSRAVPQKMLEEANTAMVDLARDYRRQQAVIDKYRSEDNSLQSFSQLTQSQPTKQQQQQQQQDLQVILCFDGAYFVCLRTFLRVECAENVSTRNVMINMR